MSGPRKEIVMTPGNIIASTMGIVLTLLLIVAGIMAAVRVCGWGA
ncbi:MAG: hypothetical protein AAB473_00695 [Patescibacteria group bacterium]